MKYLYGASIQGIQEFIFRTNKLKEISGASELVEEICTSEFARIVYQEDLKYCDDNIKLKEKLKKDPCALVNAAGNIKYEFENKNSCEQLVRSFPGYIQGKAPGIVVSQAVVAYDEPTMSYQQAIMELERKLKIQRNKRWRSNTLGLMGILRSRQTGLPVVSCEKGRYLDAASWAKLYKIEGNIENRDTYYLCRKAMALDVDRNQVAYDLENITDKNDWIAIIHADGNGLGQIVQRVGTDRQKYKKFSQELDLATTLAANTAYSVVDKKYLWGKIIPLRPVVLGGDDLTIICRADFALDYVKAFISAFEKETSKMSCFKDTDIFTEGRVKDRLSACAGIVYVKSSFPFYSAYNLSEMLCTEAKKNAKDKDSIREGKELPASCVMFYKVQDAFLDDYEELKERELSPQENISFEFGPYYLNEEGATEHNKWTIDRLQGEVDLLSSTEGNIVKSHLRQWMNQLFNNPGLAEQNLIRLKNRLGVSSDKWLKKVDIWTSGGEQGTKYYPVYDILALHTLMNQQTRRKEKEA